LIGQPSGHLVYPHPYFVNKILVFMSLQAGLRCKILKTMKFPAKYSWIRSYVTFRPLTAACGCKAWFPRSPDARDLHPTDEDLSVGTSDLGHPTKTMIYRKTSGIIVHEVGK
jgi:hypothetical protein